MGDLTFLQIFNEVKVNVGNRSDVNTQISIAIDNAYRNIAYMFHHYELEDFYLFSQVATTKLYTLPSDLRVILSVKDLTTGIKLDKRDYREFDQQTTSPSDNPTQFARFGAYIEMNPVPSAANSTQIRYAKFVSPLSSAGVSVLSNEWDEGIILGGVWRMYERLNELTKAEKAKGDYVDFLRTCTSDKALDDEDLDQPLAVRLGR